MFALPSAYVTAQDKGKAFAADYYGRLNVSAESVIGMFTERSRYCSMDSLNGRPAIGRPAIVREVRRFSGMYSGGRDFVKVLSVDAQIDVDDGPKVGKYFGRVNSDEGSDDSYSYICDDDYDDDSLMVIVHAEWTDPTCRSLAPLPFVQTFRVRCLRTENHNDRFEIVITVIKMMAATVRRLPDDSRDDFSNFERVESDYETTRGQFKQDTYPGYANQSDAEAREGELWSDVTSTMSYSTALSTDDEQEPSRLIVEQYLAYQKMVKEFLAESAAVDRQPSTLETSTVDDDDDDVGPTDRLRVDRLNKSITADRLYAAFSRYGKVLWVRIFPGRYSRDLPSDPRYPYHSANVCFDRTESVDGAMADHRGPGCTIGGVRVSFSRSRPGQ
ncbi:uncharacterized protein LOC113552310 [Rhopalosiphum maidis]|uniref:uncharacterized protein LOC113552310 n=1 Tax=Rhopalosiphum maidis TaxID=43146 RepID=UPI000F00F861|nr:uncharacterized protein LOC113552310 [Rhopalosiphum maidis]